MLIRNAETLTKLREALEKAGSAKHLRSYYLPEYQLLILDILAEDSGNPKGGVIRAIIDEWITNTLGA